jgi:hypothetical protein
MMGKIVVTSEMKAILNGSKGRQEVRDEQGNLLGYFEPATPAAEPKSKGGWGPFTAEEVEAAFKQTGPAKTLDEILKEAGLQ